MAPDLSLGGDLQPQDPAFFGQALRRAEATRTERFEDERPVGLPAERVIVTVDQHANTSAASVPLALDVAVRDGRIKPGDLLVLEAMGGGFTWGAAAIRY